LTGQLAPGWSTGAPKIAAVETEDAFSCVLNRMTTAVGVIQVNQQSVDQAEVR
jgi:hypothetical protein